MAPHLKLAVLSAALSIGEGARIQRGRARASWVISGSGCEVDGDCIQSNNHPSNYGNGESCTVELNGVVPLAFDAFSTESRYDFLNVGGRAYSGSSGPADGEYVGTISWDSDYSVTNSGWRMCRTGPPVPTPVPTPAPPTPPPPPTPTVRVVQGGSYSYATTDNRGMDPFKGFAPGGVKFFTSASPSPTSYGSNIEWFESQGIMGAEWIPIYSSNCAERVYDPQYVQMVEEADAIYMFGGQAGRISSCFFGNYSQSGIDNGVETPLMRALQAKSIVGGSSAGAMNQPMSEILITGHSVESYSAVRYGSVFQRDSGNNLLGVPQAVDVHFCERGRQGRLLVFAMQTNAQWAFGVDEQTSYLWYPSGEYEIVGKSGVVIYYGATGNTQSQQAAMHYLTEGDKININTGEITYSADKSPCSRSSAPSGSNSVFNSGLPNPHKSVSIATAQAPVGTKVFNYHGSPAVEVVFTKQENTVAMCGPSGDSFGNLLVEQSSSASVSFENTEKPNIPLDYIYPEDD